MDHPTLRSPAPSHLHYRITAGACSAVAYTPEEAIRTAVRLVYAPDATREGALQEVRGGLRSVSWSYGFSEVTIAATLILSPPANEAHDVLWPSERLVGNNMPDSRDEWECYACRRSWFAGKQPQFCPYCDAVVLTAADLARRPGGAS